MEIETEHHRNVSVDDKDILVPEPNSTKESFLEDISLSDQVMNQELSNAGEVLSKVELDFAFEKLANLSLFTMQFSNRENEFEEEEETSSSGDDSAEKTVEFDLLSSILNSEVKELESLLVYLHKEIQTAHVMLSPFQHDDKESITDFERKLNAAEQSLSQLMNQVMEMKKQSYNFEKLSSCFDELGSLSHHNDEFGDLNAKIEMQTVNQQRNVLRMLEKSLAKEMELEKKLSESRNTEYELRMRLYSSEQDVVYMEEVIEHVYSKWLEAENASEVFKGMSKEMSGKLQILRFNLSGSFKREDKLKERLDAEESALHKLDSSNARLHDFFMAQTEGLKECLKEADDKIIQLNIENSTLSDKVNSLEEQLDEYVNLEGINEDLKDKLAKTEAKAKEAELQLENAVAAVEASKEKQNLLYSTVSDMEDVIEDLKSKVLEAENKADYTEEKLVEVSESNAALNEEMKFFKGRLKEREKCLQQVEERKSRTAKDINVHNKIMKKLVIQLANERERLHKQMTNLSRENCVLMVKLRNIRKPQDTITSLTNPEEEETELKSDIGRVRRLDIGALGFKRIIVAIFVIFISSMAYFVSQQNI